MGFKCGHHHTNACSFGSILLCLLFHVHLHSCHGSDIESSSHNAFVNSTYEADVALNITESNDFHSDNSQKESEKYQINYLQKIFIKYGNGEVISFEAFEHLLQNLGLANIYFHDHGINHHIVNGSFKNTHRGHDHRIEGSYDSADNTRNARNSDHRLYQSNEPKTAGIKNDTQEQLYDGKDSLHSNNEHLKRHKKRSFFKENPDNANAKQYLSRNKRDRSGNLTDKFWVADHGQSDHLEPHSKRDWYQKSCFSPKEILNNYHLIWSEPIDSHAFHELCPLLIYQLDLNVCRSHSSHEHGDEEHDPAHSDVEKNTLIWKSSLSVWGYAFVSVLIISLVGLLSVAVIPLTTKVFYNHLLQFLVALAVGSLTGDACLHLLPHAFNPHDHLTENSNNSHHEHTDPKRDHHNNDAIWKGLVALSGIYFFFLIERIMGYLTSKNQKPTKQKSEKEEMSSQIYKPAKVKKEEIGAKLSRHKVMSCEEMLMVVHPGNKGLKDMAQDAHDEMHENCNLDNIDEEQVQGFSQAHGHNHTHGPMPSSVSAIAWMVIMGDGLHNFSDGLAIGAAFANSLSGGLSTSVAVFCHELPHELGDFAVLLRAGMRPKQAIVYNLVSSVLCLFGMILGVLVGNLSQASLWIFALIGGTFIYIALVDMVPEMTAIDPKAGEHPVIHLFLQNCGLVVGAGIMLIIAIFENDIKIPYWDQ